MRSIQLNIDCPVCSQSIRLGDVDCCTECGWQPILYTSPPDATTEAMFRHKIETAKNNYEQLRILQNETAEFKKKLEEVIPFHQMLSVQYAEIAPGYDALRQELEEVRNSYVVVDTSALEMKVRTLNKAYNELSVKVPSEYHRMRVPNVTFSCVFNTDANHVEAKVVEVHDRSKRINQEIIFAVAFFEKEILHLPDAMIIIPTEAQKVQTLNVNDSILLKIKYKPTELFFSKKRNSVVHLIANTLTEYIIK